MPSTCPIKIAANRDRALERRKAARRAKLDRVRQRINDWLATHTGPIADAVRWIAHCDYNIPISQCDISADPVERTPEVEAALVEAGYTVADARERCKPFEPSRPNVRNAKHSTRRRKTDQARRDGAPVGAYIEPYRVALSDMPRAAYYMEGFA